MRLRRPILFALFLLALFAAPAAHASEDRIAALRASLANQPADTNRVLVLQDLSVTLFRARSDSALAPAIEAEKLARKHHFWRGIMLALYAQGLAYYGGNDYEMALARYLQALELAEALGANQLQFKLVNNVGVVQDLLGRHAKALEAYHACLELAPRVGMEQHLPLVLMNIGNIYAAVEDDEAALDHFRRAADMLEGQPSPLLGSLYMNMETVCQKLNRPHEAVRYGRLSLEQRLVFGDEAGIAKGKSNLATSMLAAGKPDSAVILIDEALAVLRLYPNREDVTNALTTKGQIDLVSGRPAAARASFQEALVEASRLADPRLRHRLHSRLGHAEAALGNHEASAEHWMHFATLEDSLASASHVREIAKLEARFDAEMDMAVMEHRHRARTTVAVVTAVGVLLLAFVLLRLYEVQKRLNETLRARSEELEIEVSRRTEKLQALSRHLVKLREDERRRIARDIHDDLSQALTAIRLHLSHIRMRHGDAGFSNVLDQTLEITAKAQKESSRLIRDLRPIALEELGLFGALNWMADNHRMRHGHRVQVVLPGELVPLDEDTTIVCFRIVQEALQNVAKHADATSVAIRMEAADGGVVLSIRDDGRGFQPGNSGDDSFGLLGMEEGVRSVGGRFACTTGPGQGTEVRVWLPRLPLSAVTAAEGWA